MLICTKTLESLLMGGAYNSNILYRPFVMVMPSGSEDHKQHKDPTNHAESLCAFMWSLGPRMPVAQTKTCPSWVPTCTVPVSAGWHLLGGEGHLREESGNPHLLVGAYKAALSYTFNTVIRYTSRPASWLQSTWTPKYIE